MRYHQITLFGKPFLCDPLDSLDLTKYGEYEKFESQLVRDTVKGKRCLDIGAHIGYYSALMADAGAEFITAYEPNPFNYVYLEQNLKQYTPKYANEIFALKYGISDHKRYAHIYLSPVNSGDDTMYPFDTYDRIAISCKFLRLDEEFTETDFIKIDIQGGEIKALKGMSKLLSKNTPLTMAIEYYPDALRAAGDNPPDMLTFLWEKGFKVWEIREGAEGRLEKVEGLGICDRADLVRGYTNLWCVRE